MDDYRSPASGSMRGCKHSGGGDLSPLMDSKPLSVEQQRGVMRELDSWIGNDKYSAF
jgi:hypothetical protein